MARPPLPSYNDPGATPTNPEGGWVGIIKAAINNVSDRIDDAVNALTGKANDSTVVHLAGAETVTGTKTFTSPVSVPTATADSHAVNRAFYVANLPTGSGGTPADGSITAAKIAPAYDATLVHKTGAETVAGVKTFTSPPTVPTPVNGTDAANRAFVLANAGSGGGTGNTLSVPYSTAIAASSRTQITTSSSTAIRVYGAAAGATVPLWLDASLGDYIEDETADGGGSSLTFSVAAQGGSIDNLASINAAIANLSANGGTVELGPGIHRLSGPLNPIPANGLLVGTGGTILKPGSDYKGGLRIIVDDAVTTAGSTTVTSTKAAFVTADVGRRVFAPGIPAGATITARASATSVTISAAATVTDTGVNLTVGMGMVTLTGRNSGVRNIILQGGVASLTDYSVNPLVGAGIALGPGATRSNVDTIDALALNGWVVLAETKFVQGGMFYGVFDGIRGDYNKGGIRVAGDTSAAAGTNGKAAQFKIDNVELEVVQGGPVFEAVDINDILVGKMIGSISGDQAGVPGVHIGGVSSTIIFQHYDVGAYPTFPAVEAGFLLDGTPNNIQLLSGVSQSSKYGVLIKGGFNIKIGHLQVSRSGGAGVRIEGGDLIDLDGISYARNGKTVATGNDVDFEVTSTTARVRVRANDFTTTKGAATEQVAYVARLPLVNRVQWNPDNRIAGGHLWEEVFPVGKPMPDPLKNIDEPSDHGLLAWTDPPRLVGSASAPTASRVSGTRIYLPHTATVNTIFAQIDTTPGAGLTTAVVGIYDTSGNLLAQTASQTTAGAAGSSDWTSVGLKPMAIPSTVLQSGWYDITMLVAGTTIPLFLRGAQKVAINVNQTVPNVTSFRADTGVTALPANLGTKTADSNAWWFSLGLLP